jgi:hypothetical protein
MVDKLRWRGGGGQGEGGGGIYGQTTQDCYIYFPNSMKLIFNQ